MSESRQACAHSEEFWPRAFCAVARRSCQNTEDGDADARREHQCLGHNRTQKGARNGRYGVSMSGVGWPGRRGWKVMLAHSASWRVLGGSPSDGTGEFARQDLLKLNPGPQSFLPRPVLGSRASKRGRRSSVCDALHHANTAWGCGTLSASCCIQKQRTSILMLNGSRSLLPSSALQMPHWDAAGSSRIRKRTRRTSLVTLYGMAHRIPVWTYLKTCGMLMFGARGGVLFVPGGVPEGAHVAACRMGKRHMQQHSSTHPK